MSLDNTATTMITCLDQEGRRCEFDEAVSLARQDLDIHNPSHPRHSESLDNLANALLTRFQGTGQQSDLEEAISLYRQALGLRPSPDPLRPTSLNNLSKALLICFQEGGQASNLNEAILLPKQAIELQALNHPLRSSSLYNLADALHTQFREGGQQSHLSDAISMYQQALQLRASPHPLRSDALNGLGSALWTRFNCDGGNQSDLDRAISLYRQALELRPSPHPLRSVTLSNFAIAVKTRFMQRGHQIDLDEAILLNRQSLELRPSPHPLRFKALSNLAIVLGIQFEQGGNQTDLAEAISLHRQGLELLIPTHPFRPLVLGNLATALWTRFRQRGRQSDLDEAILLNRQTFELLPPQHPIRPMFLNNLANALWSRFGQGGHQSDLDEAILLHRKALELRPSPHSDRYMSLDNLADALSARFRQGGHQSDLDEAISLHRQALDHIILTNPARSGYLDNLATTLLTRFGREGHRIDLDEAILLLREALDIRILSHPFRSESLNNLANALRMQFEQEGQKTELDEAILLHKQALELRPSPHPDQSQSLYDLGNALIQAHSLTSDDSNYLEEAMKSFNAAAQCHNQPASLRLCIAHKWIKHAVLHQHTSTMDAYDTALQALPKLAALSSSVRSRQEALLTDSDGLARDASRFAINAGKMDKAIEFLEAGRAVFWSQFLSLRSPLEKLHDIAPELADKLRDAATALEFGSHRNTLAGASENHQRLAIDHETARLNRLNEEWSESIDCVRQLNGFEDFLRPYSFSALQVAASEGPVIILIGNDDGSDILILTSTNVQNICVSGLTTQVLRNLVHLIQAASSGSKFWLSHFTDRSGNTTEFPSDIVESLRSWIKLEAERGVAKSQGQIDSDSVFISVLKTLWNEVVKPVIDILNFEKSENPLVVQWCPTGLFSFLPIHAAGCYIDGLSGDCASDYFISSYTPTIGALLTQDQSPSPESFKMMVVIQSQELAATRHELEMIEKYVSDDLLVKLGIPGASASVEAVASRLSDVAIVHFSCHGIQDRSNPLDSGLKLEDGYLRVSRIMKEKIPNGALAFLCACETAMGDERLPDEAMSLGASLIFSGFLRVVATMWKMRDVDGPVIADAFYEELFRGPDGEPTQGLNASKSAQALHIAVKKLRAKKVSFRRWVPFIHMGK